MSGIKDTRVTMTRAERDRMVSNMQRAQMNEQRTRERLNASENARKQAERSARELNSKLEKANGNVARMERVVNQEIRSVNQQVNSMRQEQNQRLLDMQRKNEEKFNQQAQHFNNRLNQQARNFNEKLGKQREELSNMVNEVKYDLKADMQAQEVRIQESMRKMGDEINAVSDRVGQLEQTAQNHHELAEFWISQAEMGFEEIGEYRHELFAPNRLNKLKEQLNRSREDIGTQAYQSALTNARSTFMNALELKETVVNAEIEWTNWYKLVSQLHNEVKENLGDLDSLQFEFETETEEGEIDTISVAADIDYWTGDRLQELKQQFSKLNEQFQNAQNLTSQQLEELLDQLVEVQGGMNELEADSRIAIQLSQERRDMACDIVDALTEGFGFDEETSVGLYQKEGMRGTYEGTIKNPVTNDQVSFVIQPSRNEEGLMTNQLEVHYFTDDNAIEDEQRMFQALMDTIQGNGVNIGEMRCREGYEHRASDQKQLCEVGASKGGMV